MIEGNTNYYYVFSNKRNAFDVNIEKANWNGSKIEIVNCVNDGEIYADKSNAAGMIGTAYGVVTIDGCTNNGEIKGQAGDVSGVLGDITKDDEVLTIENCKNTEEIVALIAHEIAHYVLSHALNDMWRTAKTTK